MGKLTGRAGNKDKGTSEKGPDSVHQGGEKEGERNPKDDQQVIDPVIDHHTQDSKSPDFVDEIYPLPLF